MHSTAKTQNAEGEEPPSDPLLSEGGGEEPPSDPLLSEGGGEEPPSDPLLSEGGGWGEVFGFKSGDVSGITRLSKR